MKDEGLHGIEPATIEPGEAPLDLLTKWLSNPEGTGAPCTPGGICCACCWGAGLACNGWHVRLVGDGTPTSNRIASSRGLWRLGTCSPTGDGCDVQAGEVHARDTA
jgi:hypothetical protein